MIQEVTSSFDLLVNNKELWNSSLIVFCIFASVSKSMLLVASSRTITALWRRSARAIAMSCLWPALKFRPPALTSVSSVIFGWPLLPDPSRSNSVMLDVAEIVDSDGVFDDVATAVASVSSRS